MKKEYFACTCNSPEHHFVFNWDYDCEEAYLQIYLHNHKNIVKRLLVAVKYILGYKSRYGHWDSVILSYNDIARLATFFHQQKVRIFNEKNSHQI